jgi:hypothetical protein
MKVKVFTLNENKKIEFTKNELKELLDEMYNEGYKDGANKYYYTTPYKPWWSTTPVYTNTPITVCSNTSDSTSVKSETTAGTVKYNIPSTNCSCTDHKK